MPHVVPRVKFEILPEQTKDVSVGYMVCSFDSDVAQEYIQAIFGGESWILMNRLFVLGLKYWGFL